MRSHYYLAFIGFLLLFLYLSEAEAFGQSAPGVAEFQEVESDMKRFYVALSRLSYVIGAISGLLGGQLADGKTSY